MKVKKFNTYEQCISYMFGLERKGIKYDLKNIRTLLKLLNNPERNFRSIHIAGTNGKGSVSSIINSVLIEKGFKTGLYTSPHIKDFRERILVNGDFISKKFILNFVNRYYSHIEKIKPSFFEITTALAFVYFKFKKIKYAVIETGLGGRLDSTNAITPVLSAITSIGIDHTEYLGKTIKSISREKAGIIKNKVPVVIGDVSEDAKKIFIRHAVKNRSEIFFAEDTLRIKPVSSIESGFYFKLLNVSKKYFFPVPGNYQTKNIKTALTSLEVISKKEMFDLTSDTIRKGLKNLKQNSNFHGRFELISEKPKIVIDVSHNLQGIQNIKGNLKHFKYKRLFIIFGMMSDKQYKECINELSRLKAVKIILTKPEYKRAAHPEDLHKSVNKDMSEFELKKNIKEAFNYLKSIADIDDLILITGSFFLVSDFLMIFRKPYIN